MDRQIERFGFNVKYVGLDAGYFTNPICKRLSDRNIQGTIGFRLGPHEKGKYTKYKFEFNKDLDKYICPDSKELKYRTTPRDGYREYVSNSNDCCSCELKSKCLTGKNDRRTIRRHVWEDHKDKAHIFTKTDKGKTYTKREKKQWSEVLQIPKNCTDFAIAVCVD